MHRHIHRHCTDSAQTVVEIGSERWRKGPSDSAFPYVLLGVEACGACPLVFSTKLIDLERHSRLAANASGQDSGSQRRFLQSCICQLRFVTSRQCSGTMIKLVAAVVAKQTSNSTLRGLALAPEIRMSQKFFTAVCSKDVTSRKFQRSRRCL